MPGAWCLESEGVGSRSGGSGGVELDPVPGVVLAGGARGRAGQNAAQQRVALRHVSAPEVVRQDLRVHQVVPVTVHIHRPEVTTELFEVELGPLVEHERAMSRVFVLERRQRQLLHVFEPGTVQYVAVGERSQPLRIVADVHGDVHALVSMAGDQALQEIVVGRVIRVTEISETVVGQQTEIRVDVGGVHVPHIPDRM